jgi:hypothetical protein
VDLFETHNYLIWPLCTFLMWNFASLESYTHVLCFTDLFHFLWLFLIKYEFKVCTCVCMHACVHTYVCMYVCICMQARNISVMPPYINPASQVSSGHYSCHSWIAPTSFNLSVLNFSTSFCQNARNTFRKLKEDRGGETVNKLITYCMQAAPCWVPYYIRHTQRVCNPCSVTIN